MNLFLDTSSLYKLYQQEVGSEILDNIFVTHPVETVFLSDLAKVEFASTLWRKVRMRGLTPAQATETEAVFVRDYGRYSFVSIDDGIVKTAGLLIAQYGPQGLRTLDSIQFAT